MGHFGTLDRLLQMMTKIKNSAYLLLKLKKKRKRKLYNKYRKKWGQKKVLQQVTTVYTTPNAKNCSGGRGLNRIITVPISNSSTICIVKTRFNKGEN